MIFSPVHIHTQSFSKFKLNSDSFFLISLSSWTNLFPTLLYSILIHSHKHTLLFLYLYLTRFAHSLLLYLCPNRSPHWGHQQRHWGGQGPVGAPRTSQTERGQLLHQCTWLVFNRTHQLSIHITDDYKWSLTAGCDCSALYTHWQRHTQQNNTQVST